MQTSGFQSVSAQLVKRYRSAYRVFGVLKGLANVVKWFGVGLGAVIAVASLLPGKPDVGAAGVIAGAVIAIGGYITAMMLAVAPEVGQAVLDIAVNTSPFLNEEEKLQAMALGK